MRRMGAALVGRQLALLAALCQTKRVRFWEQMYAPLACNERMAAVMPRDHSGGCVLVS